MFVIRSTNTRNFNLQDSKETIQNVTAKCSNVYVEFMDSPKTLKYKYIENEISFSLNEKFIYYTMRAIISQKTFFWEVIFNKKVCQKLHQISILQPV